MSMNLGFKAKNAIINNKLWYYEKKVVRKVLTYCSIAMIIKNVVCWFDGSNIFVLAQYSRFVQNGLSGTERIKEVSFRENIRIKGTYR